MPSVALRDRASSSATPRASLVAVRRGLSLRILEHRDVEICRFFRLVIEPQHWSNHLHVSQCARRDAMQSPRCEVRAGPALHWHWTGGGRGPKKMEAGNRRPGYPQG